MITAACNYILASINLQFHKLCKCHCGVIFVNNLTPIHNVRITRVTMQKYKRRQVKYQIFLYALSFDDTFISNVIKNPEIIPLGKLRVLQFIIYRHVIRTSKRNSNFTAVNERFCTFDYDISSLRYFVPEYFNTCRDFTATRTTCNFVIRPISSIYEAAIIYATHAWHCITNSFA